MPYKDPEKRRARAKVRRDADPEGLRAYNQAWAAAHPAQVRLYAQRKAARPRSEKRRTQDTLYREVNREAIRAKTARYNAAHKEERRAAAAIRYLKCRDKLLAQGAAWEAAHPELRRAKVVRRRARKARAPINDLTGAQWAAIKAAYGYRCVYCQCKQQHLTMDHITALINGGSNTVANVVPACRSCNSKKGTRGPLIPVQPLLFV